MDDKQIRENILESPAYRGFVSRVKKNAPKGWSTALIVNMTLPHYVEEYKKEKARKAEERNGHGRA